MTDSIQLNQATLALLGTIGTMLAGVIWTLFQLVKGRMERAENQVDTLIPMARDMVVELKAIREDVARAMRDRPQFQGEPGGDWPGRRG